MTKKEFEYLSVGDKVKKNSLALDKTQNPSKLVDIVIHGVVERFNSNCSQCLIKWNDGFTSWYGRLTIELDK